MQIQRSSFLLLVGAIASTTVAAPGSSSAGDEVDASDSHIETNPAEAPGAAVSGLGGKCIDSPGAGEKSRPANFEEGFCFDLAAFDHAPEREGSIAPSSEGMGTSFNEGVGRTFDDFVFQRCNMYRSV